MKVCVLSKSCLDLENFESIFFVYTAVKLGTRSVNSIAI